MFEEETGMEYEKCTLGSLLGDPRIRQIAKEAIRRRDLEAEPVWNMTLADVRAQDVFSGDIACGMKRLFEAADTGDWYYPLYSEAECAQNKAKEGVSLVWFPSSAPEADQRPFILLVPGGGFVNVWNLTEGWPIAAQYNHLGYHVFILTYQVDAEKNLLQQEMGDFARALKLIREKEEHFHVNSDKYITCGFSAGGYLICLWNTGMGYAAYGIPKPQATFPVYPVVTLRRDIRYGETDPASCIRLYGSPLEEAAKKEYEILDHVEGFPPAAIFLAAKDELVNPENSKLLAAALEAKQIPCRLEIGPEGGHGFADGSGMCMEGWTKRAIQWFEAL
jgi:acetyl esterase/lipase